MKSLDGGKDSKPAESTSVTSKRNMESSEDVMAYWTPERMRSAVPVGLERPAPGETGKPADS